MHGMSHLLSDCKNIARSLLKMACQQEIHGTQLWVLRCDENLGLLMCGF